ncbi:MAG: TerB family tellurite resistance protein [Burkholderiales bacterium]|nr:TerB family tellurite resistance protein [Burkholderiales bacterium]
MLSAIRDFFEQHIDTPAQAASHHTIELATAALLVEVVRLDRGVDDAARAVVLRAVREKFGLSAAEAATLVELAEREAAQATDHYQFTSLVNARFSQAQKERIVELMWRVAYADAELSAYEQHTIRKLASLLHVPPSAYIAAKLRARDAASG